MTLTPLCFSTNSTFMLLPKPKLQWRSEEEDFEPLILGSLFSNWRANLIHSRIKNAACMRRFEFVSSHNDRCKKVFEYWKGECTLHRAQMDSYRFKHPAVVQLFMCTERIIT